MADAVFSACFLNTVLRNGDIVGMANYAPVVNTRGLIFTHPEGVVLRTTYHVFDMYVNLMGDQVIDMHITDPLSLQTYDGLEGPVKVDMVDAIATRCSQDGTIAIACANKHPEEAQKICVKLAGKAQMTSLVGESTEDYNDIGRDSVRPFENSECIEYTEDGICITLPPHSVNVIRITID